LSQVPDEAAPIVRALLTADRNQHFLRSRMTEEQRAGDARGRLPAVHHRRRRHRPRRRRPRAQPDPALRRGGRAGLPHRGPEARVKKCGHQGGKVLVTVDEQIKRLNAARFQLDVMGVPGIIVARTDAESATLLESCSDERDQPFILGATNVDLPSYKAGYLAILRASSSRRRGARGHLLYALPEDELAVADRVARAQGPGQEDRRAAPTAPSRADANPGAALDRIVDELRRAVGAGRRPRDLRTGVAEAMAFRARRGRDVRAERRGVARLRRTAGFRAAREKAESLGVRITWDCEHAKTRRATTRSPAASTTRSPSRSRWRPSPTCCGWRPRPPTSRTRGEFAEAIHAVYPDKMLAYNLSPSFNWDTTGMSDEEMARFPEELGKLGFVFNFITYGGHQIDGLAAEEFATALQRRRHAGARPAAAEVPAARVAVPHAADPGRRAAARRRADGVVGPHRDHQGDGQGLDAVPAPGADRGPAQAARGVARSVDEALRPAEAAGPAPAATAASDLLELQLLDEAGEKVANVVFAASRTGAAARSSRCATRTPSRRRCARSA
jgi:isocitrate lyase